MMILKYHLGEMIEIFLKKRKFFDKEYMKNCCKKNERNNT